MEDVQPVEKILAQLALFHRGQRLAIGRRHRAHRNLNILIAADAADLAFFEHAQELWLHFQRHFGDFVEKKRAAVGLFETAQMTLDGAGKGALLVAE